MTSRPGLFARLARTRDSLSSGLKGLFSSSRTLDEGLFEDIEDQLIMADLGVETSQDIVSKLRAMAKSERFQSADELLAGLKEVIIGYFPGVPDTDPVARSPRVTLMVGVNGVGKTTTLAKLAAREKNAGHTVMMAACDTFRAAAVEQLQTWGRRLDLPVIAQGQGSDAAAVAFDALQAAQARSVDHLLIDSAGRQHTQGDLMEQLRKLTRVLARLDPDAPHETWLTVDAGNGQNVLSQVETFNEATPLTGICVTKLDGTAKGGVVIAIAQRFGIPIRFIGVGEQVEDLRPFDAAEFVDALLPELDAD